MEQNQRLVICHACDALQTVSDLKPASAANCVCCSSLLYKRAKGGLERPLALILTSLLLFIIANVYPVLSLSVAGIESATTLTGSALRFIEQGRIDLAMIVWFSSVFIPGFSILGIFYVLLSIRYQLNWPYVRPVLAWVSRLLPWGMMDVFLLGVLVALVKLISMADIVLGTGFIAFVSLIVVYAAAISSVDMQTLWNCLDESSPRQRAL
ncbi:Paraquat-inducible protein A [hydrothermal vent metagenome]|uniref:Paraquat-inducible protein A n=1 Tax=hydrothermal vent metagenome TaxID=652676 RepID=A0A3B0YJA6_9ZZZZ